MTMAVILFSKCKRFTFPRSQYLGVLFLVRRQAEEKTRRHWWESFSLDQNISRSRDKFLRTWWKHPSCAFHDARSGPHFGTCSEYVLIDWVGGPDGKIFGPKSWRTDRAQQGPCAMTEGQIFSRPARPNSVNKHFIIWPPRFSIFFFFFQAIKFAIGMFTCVAHFARKVGI